MRDGKVIGFDELARYTADDLATILEVEHWQSKVGDNEEIMPFETAHQAARRPHEGAPTRSERIDGRVGE
jgi:hypothetical protein